MVILFTELHCIQSYVLCIVHISFRVPILLSLYQYCGLELQWGSSHNYSDVLLQNSVLSSQVLLQNSVFHYVLLTNRIYLKLASSKLVELLSSDDESEHSTV